jgi:antitoxin (DNA-binding transcriptional repressor) of toxin-antitoxin stability system
VKTATIQEAIERLEELIAAARSGEHVEITQDGTIVATLTPGPARVGSLSQPGRNPRLPREEFLETLGITGESRGLLEALLHEREENW